MRKLLLALTIIAISCHSKIKNPLLGKWQLIKKSNDHEVIFQFNPTLNSKKFVYWFENDSTLITQDDDGGNTKHNTFSLSADKITLFDSLHSNIFFYKVVDQKLSLKSLYSPFHLELKKMN